MINFTKTWQTQKLTTFILCKQLQGWCQWETNKIMKLTTILIWWQHHREAITKKKGHTKFHKDHVISSQTIMHHIYFKLNINYECSYNNQNHSSPTQCHDWCTPKPASRLKLSLTLGNNGKVGVSGHVPSSQHFRRVERRAGAPGWD
jgi:hypothetical protein